MLANALIIATLLPSMAIFIIVLKLMHQRLDKKHAQMIESKLRWCGYDDVLLPPPLLAGLATWGVLLTLANKFEPGVIPEGNILTNEPAPAVAVFFVCFLWIGLYWAVHQFRLWLWLRKGACKKEPGKEDSFGLSFLLIMISIPFWSPFW